jgi:hypothetical protein
MLQALQVCKHLLQRNGSLSLEDLAAKSFRSFVARAPQKKQCSAITPVMHLIAIKDHLQFYFHQTPLQLDSPQSRGPWPSGPLSSAKRAA